MNDANLFFRNTTDSLTQTETSSALDIGGTPAGGAVFFMHVPKQSQTDTIVAKLLFSTDDSDYTDEDTITIAIVSATATAVTAGRSIRRRFHTRYRYVKLELTVAGTSPDYGAVRAGVNIGPDNNFLGVGQNAASQHLGP